MQNASQRTNNILETWTFIPIPDQTLCTSWLKRQSKLPVLLQISYKNPGKVCLLTCKSVCWRCSRCSILNRAQNWQIFYSPYQLPGLNVTQEKCNLANKDVCCRCSKCLLLDKSTKLTDQSQALKTINADPKQGKLNSTRYSSFNIEQRNPGRSPIHGPLQQPCQCLTQEINNLTTEDEWWNKMFFSKQN